MKKQGAGAGSRGYIAVTTTAIPGACPPMTSYPASVFSVSRTAFDALVGVLSSDDALHISHGELEQRVLDDGREVMRLLVQDHLDLRAARERALAPESLRGADGDERTEVRPSKRPLGTLVGGVVVHRLAFVKRGASGGLRPMDAELNLPVGLYSEGVQREVVWGVAQGSYDTVVADLRRTTGAGIAKRQAEELCLAVASDFESFYLEQPRQEEHSQNLVVLSFDGAGVVMRPEGLREGTRKRAEQKAGRKRSVAESAATLNTRSEERGNRKRMAEVAAVYSLKAVPRSPEDVLRELRHDGPHLPRPRAENKRVWATLVRPITDVVDHAFYEALCRDEKRGRQWVALLDGNPEQIAAVHRMAHNVGVSVTIVLDLIHVLGYLWKAGNALHDGDIAATEAWVSERTLAILRGDASLVAAGMRRSATNRSLRGARRKAVDECASYLLKYRQYLLYHEYLRAGYPIATGVIEGACRSLVKDRMDITGARWGLAGAEAVLALRSLRASGDLDDYLAYRSRLELERNHLSRYDAGELRRLRAAA